jgi:thiosulfate/3-mercaptopyruvate sulfurtransferase
MAERNGLVTTAELAGLLGRPELRLFDCTTYLEPAPAGSSVPYLAVPGRHTFEAGHIPGADFLDLQGEFSDQTTGLRFMMPGVAQLEAAFGRHGVGNASRVVLYSIGSAMWATRFWWMLKSIGFEGASVLDGGLDKWKAEGRAIETGPAKGYPPAAFTAKPKPGYFVDSRETLKASTNRNAVVAMRWDRNSTGVWSRAATAGPAAFPAASTCRRRPCSIRKPRPLSRLPTPRKNSQALASRKTSA